MVDHTASSIETRVKKFLEQVNEAHDPEFKLPAIIPKPPNLTPAEATRFDELYLQRNGLIHERTILKEQKAGLNNEFIFNS
ncbi:hypothetical protein UA08_08182 [Talaromyces atroroseus]|uniref:Uncharacterized protein n=1 Tax=Talaromyces atroroseus TaxID=1441469 RepID=A0A225A8X9_TALAT|nr:hypothetical protein UA08_08182 [Talaromyces atroroseus]OKL56430.1 hypothetical protein UA08_08182 [Talaromyces atroroseus]